MDGLKMLSDDAPESAPQGAEDATSFDLVASTVDDKDIRALASWSAKYHVDDLDPLWGGMLVAKISWSGSVAAGQAAQAVQAGVAAIPDQIFQGAIKAGNEIKGALATEIRGQGVEVGQALKLLIDTSAAAGATTLKTAAADLDLKMGKVPAEVQQALDAYKAKGVSEFAKAAQVAGEKLAQSSLLAQASRSVLLMIMAFLLAALVGAGGLWGWLLISHRVMPVGVVAMSDPLRGGTLVMVPDGGKPVHDCPAGLCLIYKKPLPDLP